MRAKQLPLLLLALGGTLTAGAQTGRIAHLSHGGSPATLAATERADNFGLPSTEYRYQKFTRLNDSVMLGEGLQRAYRSSGPWQPYKWQQQYQWGAQRLTGPQLLHALRQQYPEAKFIGFDTTAASQPQRKKSAFELELPTGPTLPPSTGPLLALVVLAAAGWLLAGKPRPALAPATT